MNLFLNELMSDLRRIGWKTSGMFAFIIVAVYGMLLMNPTTAYDFNAAKGDFFQVFLTYFFMRRFAQGLVAGLFHDFTPLWNWSVGLLFLFFFACLLWVVSHRLKLSHWHSLVFAILWLSAPFFFNRSIYQHAMPAEPIAFCLDAVLLLLFIEMRKSKALRGKVKYIIASAICGFASLSIYQAHANLILTALFGVCVLAPRQTWRDWCNDVLDIVIVLALCVVLWVLVNWGPILGAKFIGVTFPPSGGAHDTVYWFEGAIAFRERIAGLFVGLLLNWGYNAFFVIGLRWVLIFIVLGLAVSIRLLATKRYVAAAYMACFILTIFAMPCLQCSSANLRIFYCLNPFVAFSGLLLVKLLDKNKTLRILSCFFVGLCILSLAHETSTLYYYQWKSKNHDALHMGNVATDLWRKYGIAPNKPVAVIGGWSHYPTCWEDMRPNRDMPLLNHPFSTYSNMTDWNVPREFYMVAREKVGLVVNMPSNSEYGVARQLVNSSPAYPQDGYIFENNGVIIVNLGEHMERWKHFDFASFRSPNEQLLFNTLKEERWNELKRRLIRPFLCMASKYRWTLSQE